VVTGGSEGIGRAWALALAERGTRVWIVGRRPGPLQDAAELRPDRLHPFAGDAADPAAMARLAALIEQSAPALDLLVTAAAILGPLGTLEEVDPAAVAEVLRVNVLGTLVPARALLPLLRRSPDGNLVTLSSGVGRKGRARWGAYAASKFGVEGLVQCWADEERGRVRVHALNPGPTRTAMRAAAAPQEDPLTIPTPEDLVPSLFSLLSVEARAAGVSGGTYDCRGWIGATGGSGSPSR
jgi:NAD(P)-dependent dehydrogenase (short-subunit alcohol dehydrogenase family)